MGGNRFTNILKSIISGDILLQMRVDRLFPYIFYLFVLGTVNIWLIFEMEQTMVKAEANSRELETLKIYHAQKTCEYVSMDRISTVEAMLEKSKSEVKAPQKPADIIRRK